MERRSLWSAALQMSMGIENATLLSIENATLLGSQPAFEGPPHSRSRRRVRAVTRVIFAEPVTFA